jgi:hypothetical protein
MHFPRRGNYQVDFRGTPPRTFFVNQEPAKPIACWLAPCAMSGEPRGPLSGRTLYGCVAFAWVARAV